MQTDRDVVIYLPQRVVPAGTTRHGLVIGINHYADERLNLRYAVADAQDLHELMVDPECGCFPPENVQLLVDHEATTEGIFRALARLRRRAAESDMVWIYYAGHAAVEDNAYWVTHDADVDDLFATALHDERIKSVFAQLRTKRVLQILDCCYAETTALMKNPTRQSATAKELFDRFEGYGVITLAASNEKQRSIELSELGHGAFTYFLAKGLRGDADTDNEGVVTAEKLWSYLGDKVAAVSGHAGNPQTPMIIGKMTPGMALTLNAAVAANKRRLKIGIEKFVGIGADQLTTDEGRLCVDVLRRNSQTKEERALLESVEELVDGKLTLAQFRRLLQLVTPTIHAAINAEARAAAEAERARVEVKQQAEARVRKEAEARAAEAEHASGAQGEAEGEHELEKWQSSAFERVHSRLAQIELRLAEVSRSRGGEHMTSSGSAVPQPAPPGVPPMLHQEPMPRQNTLEDRLLQIWNEFDWDYDKPSLSAIERLLRDEGYDLVEDIWGRYTLAVPCRSRDDVRSPVYVLPLLGKANVFYDDWLFEHPRDGDSARVTAVAKVRFVERDAWRASLERLQAGNEKMSEVFTVIEPGRIE